MEMNQQQVGRGRRTRRSGSALIEFAVGMIPMMVLVVGLLQIVTLARTRMDTLREARSQAGMLSTLSAQTLSSPAFIRDWQVAADEHHMTVDDTFTTADSSGFMRDVVDRSVVNSTDWDIMAGVPNSPFYRLHRSGNIMSEFGLVEDSEEATVELLPAVRLLFDNQENIDVNSIVWMSWTKGLR